MNKNLFVLAYRGGRIVFRIDAMTPTGDDGIGTVFYYYIDDSGKFRESMDEFGLLNTTMKSGTRLSLKGLRDAWQELDEGKWIRLRAEEQFFLETIK